MLRNSFYLLLLDNILLTIDLFIKISFANGNGKREQTVVRKIL